jgi:DNA invertase Pin-like site-specific DNA recombinase
VTVAYSYARFSSEKQKHGSSLQRQLEAATKYAHTHGLVLDPSTYKDLGVSAFRSKNVDGALGAFIETVDAGKVTKGSYLLVENLDRLSRDTADVALELFLGIIRRGIVLVTLTDGRVYSQATIRENQGALYFALGEMVRANMESARKAGFARAAIQRRADKGQLPTTRLPTWLKFSADRKSAVMIPSRARIVKYIFDQVIDGIGAREIARELNKRKHPVLSYAKEWRQSAISQLLKNPATYGEFKGEIVLPAAITKARFLKAQQIVRDRTLYKGGFARFNPNNTFVGLAKCGHCGRPMRYLPRTDGTVYLKCVGSADHGVCNGRMFPFVPCETALVHHLAMLESTQGLTRAIFAEKYEQFQIVEAEIALVESKQERLIKLGEAAESADDIKALGRRLKMHQDDIKKLENQRKALGPVTDEADNSLDVLLDYDKLIDAGMPEGPNHLFEMGTKSGISDIEEFRRKLKMAFVRVLQKVEFLNADEKKWLPTLRLTYVNGRTATVDVLPWLSERTQKWIANGTYHRSDLGRKRKPSTKTSG